MNYKELEFLLDQLQGVIGYTYCVFPPHLYDGFHLAVFGSDDKLMWEQTCINLEECVNNFLTWKKEKDG